MSGLIPVPAMPRKIRDLELAADLYLEGSDQFTDVPVPW